MKRASSAVLLLTAGLALAQADTPEPTRAQAPVWTRIAIEGAPFTVPAGSIVRYGVRGSMVEREVSGDGECSNAFFGSDPARERVKVCEVSGAAAGASPARAAARSFAPTTAPAGAVTYHFSDCQTGAAAGCACRAATPTPARQSAPKQNLAGINVNALPAGSQLLFNRGGAWNWTSPFGWTTATPRLLHR